MTKSASALTFGKHKGRTLDEIIEEDPDYVIWLADQSWSGKKVPGIFDAAARVQGSKEDTPVHNKLQAKFLDERFLLAFFEIQLGTTPTEFMRKRIMSGMKERTGKIDDALKTIDARISELDVNEHKSERSRWIETRERIREIEVADIKDFDIRVSSDAKFEAPNRRVDGNGREQRFSIDVLATLRIASVSLTSTREMMWINISFPNYNHYDSNSPENQLTSFIHLNFDMIRKVEVKPTLSDDYPTVLRDMQRSGSDVLLVGEYTSESVAKEQMVEIFRRADIGVVFDPISRRWLLDGDSA